MSTSHFGNAKLILVLVMIHHCWANCTISQIERLYNQTILATDHRYRPTLNQSEATIVHLSLNLLSLADFDEVRQSMSGNVVLTVTWVDEMRTWNPDDYGGLTKIHPDRLDIWRPRLFLSNSIGERDMFEDDYAPLTIFNTGLTKWRPGGILNTFCPMKMTHFPFDTQTCTLNFTTGEYAEDLKLTAVSRNINLSNFDIHGEWMIDTSEVQSLVVADKSTVKFVLRLKRISSFAMLNIVIPVNIISSLSSLTFIMPAESGERVSFSITVLLSLTVYTGEISQNLPTNSESLPLLIMYLTCLLLHSGLAIVANLVMLIRYHASRRPSEDDVRAPGSQTSEPDLNYSFSLPEKSRLSFEDKAMETENKSDNKKHLTKSDKSTLSNRKSRSHLIPRKKKDYINFVRSFDKEKIDEKRKENCGESVLGCRQQVTSPLLRYITSIDFILFLTFLGLWFVITVVFMALMANVGGKIN